ncbi:hypothetical protein [Paramicrobacterium agarici]|nr:hypothetical protein [Microbacterium agarici]
MRFIKPLPDSIREPVSVATARERGATRSQLRNTAFRAPFHGTRVLGPAEPSLQVCCTALMTRLPDGSAISHLTAADLRSMRLPLARRDGVHATVPPSHRAPRHRGVHGHSARLRDTDVTLVDGIPTTTVERTWCDLGALLSLPELVAVADGALWIEDATTTLSDLRDAMREHRNRPYFPKLRRALELTSAHSASRPESLLRVHIVLSDLPDPIPNYTLELTHRAGHRVLDLAYPKYRLGLEYHGDHHRTDKHQWHTDIQRANDIVKEDWEELQFTGADLPRLDVLLAQVERRLRARGWVG